MDAMSLLDARHTYLAREAQVLNSYMKKDTSLQNFYEKFQAIGLVQTQDDFSRLCGRTPTWFSSLKARGIPLSVAAAITLQIKLNEFIASGADPSTQKLAARLSDEIMQLAHERCSKEMA